MKKTMRIFSMLLALVLLILPYATVAEGAYEYLKLLMGLEIVSDVKVPEYMDVSSSLTGDNDGLASCLINLLDEYIVITGYTSSNKFEALLYNDLSEKQLYVYAISVCTMFTTINEARTTTANFTIGLKYGEGEDDLILIANEKTAREVSDILTEMAKDIK